MCTSIIVRHEKGAVMGRNMDYEHPVDYNVLYLPKDFIYGNDLFDNPLKNKYRMMGLCFYDENPLKDGINEHGLIGCTNSYRILNAFSSSTQKGKVNISSLDFLNYILGNFKTVEEIRQNLENIHVSNKDYQRNRVLCPEFHYMFMDKEGDSAIVELKDKKYIYMENKMDIMTNSPIITTHEKRLRKIMDLDKPEDFNPAKNLPGGYDPVSRFIKAYFLTKNHVPANNHREAMENAYSILEAMKVTHGFLKLKQGHDYSYTRYTCCYESQTLTLSVRNHKNPRIFAINFHDIKEEKRTSIKLTNHMEMERLKID